MHFQLPILHSCWQAHSASLARMRCFIGMARSASVFVPGRHPGSSPGPTDTQRVGAQRSIDGVTAISYQYLYIIQYSYILLVSEFLAYIQFSLTRSHEHRFVEVLA